MEQRLLTICKNMRDQGRNIFICYEETDSILRHIGNFDAKFLDEVMDIVEDEKESKF
jgi:hypothetical protein